MSAQPNAHVRLGVILLFASLTFSIVLLMFREDQGPKAGTIPPAALTKAEAGGVEPPLISPVAKGGRHESSNPILAKTYGRLPLAFEENQGQSDSRVKFISRGPGYRLFLTATEAVLALNKPDHEDERGRPTSAARNAKPGRRFIKAKEDLLSEDVVRMKLIGADPTATIKGSAELPGKSNYLIGSDPAKWRVNVPTFRRVCYREIYAGIDLVYYGNQRQLEYDFIVSPGADPKAIRIAYQGTSKIEINDQGDLLLYTSNGQMTQRKPILYQVISGTRTEVAGRYVLNGEKELGFEIHGYDATKPLIIDPVFVYSTYLGGSGEDIGTAVANDAQGNAYVTGRTLSTNFPTANPYRSFNSGGRDIFVTKLNSTGTAIVYSTYIGGSQDDLGLGIALNSSGEAYVTGYTKSPNFPLVSALQPFYGGGVTDAFLTRLNASGNALITSTYAGGTGTDIGTGVALDNSRNIYGIGYTTSTDLQTVNSIQPFLAGGYDGYLLELSPSATSIVFSTYVGGSADDFGNAIAVDPSGYIYAIGDTSSTNLTTVNPLQAFNAGGFDAFLGKLTPSGTNIVFSTYAGGSGDDSGAGIAVDGAGNILAVGYTNSTDLQLIVNAVQPIKAFGYDAFVAKLSSSGTTILYSTFWGGNSTDAGYNIATDVAGNAYVIGEVSSTDFPLLNPLQATKAGARDIFLTKFSSTGAVLFSTYLGGAADDNSSGVAADQSGNAYLTGYTASTNFLTANPLQPLTGGGQDGFVAKIGTNATPTPTPTPTDTTIRLVSSTYLVGEGSGSASIVVSRLGSTAAAARVDYKTSDTAGLNNCNVVNGVASSRCDYALSVGTVRFAAGEASKTISIPLVDDSYAEGSESFSITLSNPSGGVLGAPASATVSITDNESVNGPNPIDRTDFFVRQQYVDFLNREPDPPGFAAWQDVINNCPAGDTTCDRIHVSSAFFRSPEFQERGYFVYRFYPVSFGRKPDYLEFIPDLAQVSGFLSPAELEAAKVAFINDFMARPAFANVYNPLNNSQYVDALLLSAGITHAARDFWIAALTNGTRTRAQVLREIADSTEVYNKYYNQAFVVMQYFGYLRRDPDSLYLNWIAHLDSTGDYRSMINGFMNSLEYRLRFGP